MVQGTLIDMTGVWVRSALPIGEDLGGLPEIVIPFPAFHGYCLQLAGQTF
jgi:hypothetical protein